jgi:hypothetical protein
MGWYFGIGQVLGAIVGVVTFVGGWIYCIATYGFLLGVGLGWLPSSIAGFLAFGLTALLWGPVAIAIGLIVWKAIH